MTQIIPFPTRRNERWERWRRLIDIAADGVRALRDAGASRKEAADAIRLVLNVLERDDPVEGFEPGEW